MDEGVRTFEHTADLGLEIRAATPERLLELAATGLEAQVAEAPDRPEIERRLELEGDDPADLFVHWLNTVLLESDVHQAIWTRCRIERFDGRRVAAILAGPRRSHAGIVFLREVKAVSQHGLELDLTPGRCRARVVLDL